MKRISEEIKKHLPSDHSQNRFGATFGKPQFPDLPLNIMEASLEQFVGKDSWSFFRILKLESSFLDLPVESWDKDEGFKAAETVVKNIKVVNDSAEHGIKLCSDFLLKAKKTETFQNIENNRNENPYQRNNKKEYKKWFVKI